MNLSIYEFLIPQATLLIGVFVTVAIKVWGESTMFRLFGRIQLAAIGLAFVQQLLMYRMPASIYLRGGMALDGLTQILSVIILLAAGYFYILRLREEHHFSIYSGTLFLLFVLFVLVLVQTNRIMFGTIALLGAVWSAHGFLAHDGLKVREPVLIHRGILLGLLLLLPLVLLNLLSYGLFTETQLDEIQRQLMVPTVSKEGVFYFQGLVLFVSLFVLGVPPFTGLLGTSRRYASWALGVGATVLLALGGVAILTRWGLTLFSRPSLGSFEFDAISPINFFPLAQWALGGVLVLLPLLAIINRDLRGGFLLFILSPFAQSAFALTFGNREVVSYGLGQLVSGVLAVGAATAALSDLGVGPKHSLKDWVGVGRRNLGRTAQFLIGCWALSGFLPFFGGVLNMKALSSNVAAAPALLLHLLFSGIYVLHLSVLAFQRSAAESPFRGADERHFTWLQKIFWSAQSGVLILLGIFWQPLYKYGALSIRHFFGE